MSAPATIAKYDIKDIALADEGKQLLFAMG